MQILNAVFLNFESQVEATFYQIQYLFYFLPTNNIKITIHCLFLPEYNFIVKVRAMITKAYFWRVWDDNLNKAYNGVFSNY